MKKIIVILFFVSILMGAWQESKEFALPKSIQVNDLTIGSAGELWVLSASSILKYETAADKPFLIHEIDGGKILAVQDNTIHVISQDNRLISIESGEDGLAHTSTVSFSAPERMLSIQNQNNPIVILQESSRLSFYQEGKVIGVIPAQADAFTAIPSADYSKPTTPLFTLSNNKIFSWNGGSSSNASNYSQQLLYSASHNIFDLTADHKGNLYVLFADSVVVLESNGTYRNKIPIENVPQRSRIMLNPANNSIVVYHRTLKTLKTIANLQKTSTGDVITLYNNQPNPVDNYTEIEFSLGKTINLSLTVYNLIGEPVKVIARGRYTKGTHRVVWHADDERGNMVPNGVYFYRLESDKGVAIRQLIVLR